MIGGLEACLVLTFLRSCKKGAKLEIGLGLPIWPHEQDSISSIAKNNFQKPFLQ